MTPFRKLSIKNKLTVLMLLITVSSLGSAFAFAVWTQIRTFRRDMVTSTVLVARVIADSSVSDLAFGDRSESQHTLERLRAVPTIRYAYLYDARGELFAVYGGREGPDLGHPGADGLAEFRDGALHVTQPIVYKNDRYGTIHLCASTEDLDRTMATYVAMMLAGMAGLTVLAFVSAVRLQAVISGPILGLADAARRISQAHDYSIRVQKTGEDEIGTLYDGFNEMLTQIQERELERDRADRRTREKSQFLANMSHELRTPMNSIIGFSEILLTRLADRLNPRELKFLQNIHTSGQHLLGIINDILDLSKVEAGRMEVHPEPFAVRAMIDGVCNVMKGVSSKRNVMLSVDAPEDLPLLEADPVKFKQILYNLVSNAVKFSPYNATVSIRAAYLRTPESPLGEEAVEVQVSDQGPGIDPKDHALIFQEFRQAEGAQAVEGTGLGLALVKRFVELHRGTVTVRSARGQGTSFTVLLPLSFVRRTAPAAPARILVVGDDTATWETIRRQLEAAGHTPLRARDREEAIRLARSERPAAITLDPLLPSPDGWEVLKALKADPDTRGIPVIILPVVDDQQLGPALGVADYFLTPVDQEHFVSRLRSLTPKSPSGLRLLVIDDEAPVHEMLEAWLSPHGWVLDHARSGAEGIERAVARPPDAIILDLLMQEVDGFEVAVRLKADPRTAPAPIIVLTAKDLTDLDRRRLRGKVVALIEKGPSTEARLVSVIEELLRPREAAAGA